MVWLKRAPSTATLLSVIAEITKAMNTPRIVRVCDSRRPIRLPPSVVPKMPAAAAPASGASGTASRVAALRVVLIVSFLCTWPCHCGPPAASHGCRESPGRTCLAFQLVQFFDVEVRLVPEQQHE